MSYTSILTTSLLAFWLLLPATSHAEQTHREFTLAALQTCQAEAPRPVCDCALERLMDAVQDPSTINPDETTLLQNVQQCREVLAKGQWASFAQAVQHVQSHALEAPPTTLDETHVDSSTVDLTLLEPVRAALMTTPVLALRAWRWDANAKALHFAHPDEGWSVAMTFAKREDWVMLTTITRTDPVVEGGSPVGQDGQPSLTGKE